ncbi:MAG: S41 family peptidase [Saprospiraceae bacterium]
MKKSPDFYTLLILSCLFLTLGFRTQAQSIDKHYKTEAINTLKQLMNERYVFPDVAQKTSAHLDKQLQSGQFDASEDLESFAKALTIEVQSINKDKHMRIRPMPPFQAPENTPSRMIEEHLNQLKQSRASVAGFQAIEKLDGNIGYIDLRGFYGVEVGGPMADLAMKMLATSDAMIIDLRKNGGGSPGMVQYLCSYFFDKRVHLNSLYWRQSDETQEFWTLDKVAGKKMPDVPLFILTSSRTFSGAEEFSYNMQTQKRATLVGETTGGGANPGGTFRINKDLTVFIPTGTAINPITGTNWEGVGVIPEVKTSKEDALDKAIALATEAAAAYREKTEKKVSALLQDLFKQLTSPNGEEASLASLKEGCELGILGENDINMLGYYFLQEVKNSQAAELVLKNNTLLFPSSANVFDSYGEALATNGKIAEAAKSYRKAVELAKANQDPNLELFEENLERVEGKLKKSN